MRLVGASNWFVRGPFLIQGILAGGIAAIIAFILTFLFSYGADSRLAFVLPGISLFGIFLKGAFSLLLVQLGTGVGLGAVSSLIAIRKYLKI